MIAIFFRFLFENQSPAHVYYRWKLFTILQVTKKINKEKPFGSVFFSYLMCVFFIRGNRQPNGEQMTLGCLKMALSGVHHLSILTSMVLMMTVRKRRKKRRAARKAA